MDEVRLIMYGFNCGKNPSSNWSFCCFEEEWEKGQVSHQWSQTYSVKISASMEACRSLIQIIHTKLAQSRSLIVLSIWKLQKRVAIWRKRRKGVVLVYSWTRQEFWYWQESCKAGWIILGYLEAWTFILWDNWWLLQIIPWSYDKTQLSSRYWWWGGWLWKKRRVTRKWWRRELGRWWAMLWFGA